MLTAISDYQDRITEALVKYFGKDHRRIVHAMAVLRHAKQISGTRNDADPDVLAASALLHDVGIKPAEELHGYNNGPLQEKYGPSEAKRLLDEMGFPEAKTAKVMEIIGNHHSRSRYDYVELEILKEADAIVNRAEESEPGRLASSLGYAFRIIPAVIMFVLLAAHFLRWSQYGPAVLSLVLPLLLISKRRWVPVAIGLLLLAGTWIWVKTGISIVMNRISDGEDWIRAAGIMGTVALLTAGAAALLGSKSVLSRHRIAGSTAGTSTAAFLLVLGIGGFPQIRMHDPIPILAERIISGAGWLELLLLAIYAAWLIEKLLNSDTAATIRRNVWICFSIVFFLQAALGVAGISILLMTGSLHLPIPAMIVAAPLYRGELALFMPILLIVTILTAGPAWCSWFCYFGSWDHLAARAKTIPGALTRRNIAVRSAILIAICAAAVFLRSAGFSPASAAIFGILFAAGGILVMLTLSRKRGVMVHCTAYCPIGLIATVAGKLSPFRIRISRGCTECQACSKICRYGALTPQDIRSGAPALTCTLCGDCLQTCSGKHIGYSFPGLNPTAARKAFLVIVVVIHALFLGFARI